MRPVNEKSLLHFLFVQMEKLDEGVITSQIGESGYSTIPNGDRQSQATDGD